MLINILLLFAALAVLALLGVPAWLYPMILVAGLAPSLIQWWRSLPRQRLARRGQMISRRVHLSRSRSRLDKLNGARV